MSKVFLDTLFSGKPQNDLILIWEKGKSLVSHWFKSTDEADKLIQQLIKDNSSDIYVGCGTRRKNLGMGKKGENGDIYGIGALWLDIDVNNENDPSHERKNNPKTFEEARELINFFPLEPTILIHSGHGYHVWWAMKEFWNFETKDHRAVAATTLEEFQRVMKANASAKGLNIDSTFDVARVLRIPGTMNMKKPPHVPVVMESGPGKSYSMIELTVAIKQCKDKLGITDIVKQVSGIVSEGTPSQYTINTDAQPPHEMWQGLFDHNEKFAQTWRMQRKDLKDGSNSAYDYSMINFALHNGWSDQHAVDLVMYFRKTNNLPPKVRRSYFDLALRKVKEDLLKDESVQEVEEILDAIKHDEAMPKEQRRVHVKNHLSTLLNVQVDQIIQYGSDSPEFKIVVGGRLFKIGSIAVLTNQFAFRNAIAVATRIWIPPFKKERWDVIVQALLDAAELEEIGEDETDVGQMKTWLQCYLEFSDPRYDRDDACRDNKSFFLGDKLYISSIMLRQYLFTHHKELFTGKTLGIILKEFGFTSCHVNYKNEKDTYSSRNLWCISITNSSVKNFVNHDLLDDANRIRAEMPWVPRGSAKEEAFP